MFDEAGDLREGQGMCTSKPAPVAQTSLPNNYDYPLVAAAKYSLIAHLPPYATNMKRCAHLRYVSHFLVC